MDRTLPHRTPRPWRRLLGAPVLALWVTTATSATSAEPLRTAPPLTATLLDGHSFTLQHKAGKVLILNFWATWCAPCREEMPAIRLERHVAPLLGA